MHTFVGRSFVYYTTAIQVQYSINIRSKCNIQEQALYNHCVYNHSVHSLVIILVHIIIYSKYKKAILIEYA